MSGNADIDENSSHRTATAPYTSHHPVPNIHRYEEGQQQRKKWEHADNGEDTANGLENYIHGNSQSDDPKPEPSGTRNPYGSENRNSDQPTVEKDFGNDRQRNQEDDSKASQSTGEGGANKNTNQTVASEIDPRRRRKNMKHMKRDHEGREVTDPVTHLPVTIHDSTENELKNVPENLAPAGSEPRTSTGLSAASKSDSQLSREQEELEAEHRGMERLFPPPNFQAAKDQLIEMYNLAITIGISTLIAVFFAVGLISQILNGRSIFGQHQIVSGSWLGLLVTFSTLLLTGIAVGGVLIWGIRDWLDHRANDIWEDEIWDASREQERQHANTSTPESTQWLNSLLASIWPLINPDLFTSLADTLEDVMQASLPKMVRMISVEDLGQGQEALRILGVRWLPTGAAAKSVSVDGRIKSGKKDNNEKQESDRTLPGQGELEEDAKPSSSESSTRDEGEEGNDENIAEGMEAEEGDFVNVEVAFSYRASSSGKGIKKKAKSAHLFLAFYLPGGIRFPVWVELRGIIGTMRMRLQLCPDPPFFSLCTLTLLGQPKANLSCIPLTKHGLNIMDLPIISSFVQNSIDAALAEYVAPKSLTLDLRDMLVGDDFKKDPSTRGVVVVRIKRALDFKEGDGNLGGLKKGSSDPYVAVGWSKFGKPVWSTRIILDEMEPVWDETAFVLVGSEELNAGERLRVQLWDSDRTSADDDLGKVEVDLKDLMRDTRSNGKMWDRKDGMVGMDSEEKMPGFLEWSVGYYGKVRIQEDQLEQQDAEPEIRNIMQLKEKVSEDVEKKLREATEQNISDDSEQQKVQGLKTREGGLIISSPPPTAFPTGIFSIQVHNITGLQFENINKKRGSGDEGNDIEGGESDDLPSSYCTVILNHQKIFKTRTKPKNSDPFFNAGVERLIRDWKSTEIMLSVRDSRVHEDDPLLGIVYLPLGHIFRNRSQLNDTFPLVGGIGYGRVRVSMVFRSIQLQAPRELLGWDYGTLEVTGPITTKDLSSDLCGLRLKLRTSVNRGKLYSTDSKGRWTGKRDRRVYIAVRKRYSSCLVIEFRKSRVTLDQTPAFAILWLKDIPDDEERTVNLPVWKGHAGMKRAETNCLETMGDKVGSIEVPLKFRPGLGGYHKKLISKNPNIKDVFEVVDTASDNREVREFMANRESDSESSDEDNSQEDEDDSRPSTSNVGDDEHDKHNQDDGRHGPLDQLKDYKDHHHQLHRQHKGVMQYKGARTAQWMKTKMEHGKEHILDNFKHHDRNPGIETEV